MRLFDFLMALTGLIILCPLFLVISLFVKLSSPGPVLHQGQRVGTGGGLFNLYKFRTMAVGADKMGPAITPTNDPRVTKVGRILRRTKLDEIPQLINVLKGDMSFVGPRPEDPRYVSIYTADQQRILAVRPGITSAASLTYRHEEKLLSGPDWEKVYRDEVLPAKLAIDLVYFSNRTFFSDLLLIFRTILSVFH